MSSYGSVDFLVSSGIDMSVNIIAVIYDIDVLAFSNSFEQPLQCRLSADFCFQFDFVSVC